MEESLEDRLKSHAQAFDGLLSLIPAKFYYEDDKSEQWQRKKQTKDQAKAAKLAKLNPDNARTARDILDEREARSNGGKRKRDDEDENRSGDSQDDPTNGINQEKPMEGLKRKKVKADSTSNESAGLASKEQSKAEIKAIESKEKADRKRFKTERRKEKLKEKAHAKQTKAVVKKGSSSQQNESQDVDESDDGDEVVQLDLDLGESAPESPPSVAPSPSFDVPSTISGTSSISSIATQNATNTKSLTKKQSAQGPPTATQEELRARLQARIAELRHARRADGDADRPARSRTELIEQRRKKAEQKKAAKKALRAQANEEERRKRNEALARGSPLTTPLGNMSPAQISSPSGETPNFSFSRVAFDNGQVMSANLSSVLNPQKKSTLNSTKISKDTLDTLEKRQDRLANMTPEQRATAEEKDMWLNAKNRAQGLRIKDDTSLLKKALNRKDNKKKKSTKDWDARLAGVASAQAAKQKRREDNLAKRKEERGNKGSKGKKASTKGKKKVKSRPGFEGSFKTASKSQRKH